VENLWMFRENPVHASTLEILFGRDSGRASMPPIVVGEFSSFASLDPRRQEPQNIALTHPQQDAPTLVTKVVHRFEESIAGKPYLIEVALVSHERWRADIVRIPGLPTALMPFYGRTPDEAARHLTDWLSRAHGRPASVASK
jgi:hypothetical protein